MTKLIIAFFILCFSASIALSFFLSYVFFTGSITPNELIILLKNLLTV